MGRCTYGPGTDATPVGSVTHCALTERASAVPGLEADAAVEDVGEGSDGLRESIDTAYRDKYGSSGSSSMVEATAAATTLRLSPDP